MDDVNFSGYRMRQGKRGLQITALLLVAALAACGDDVEAGGGPPGGFGGNRGPTPVETILVSRGEINREVSVAGVVEPIRTVGINSQLGGAVLNVHAEEGSMVREGTVLARIDDRELAVQEASAEAAYNVAKAAFERAEQLLERQVITVAEYERERTAFAAAEAQLEQIRTRRAYATVTAPVSGVVLEKMIEAGDIIGTQNRLFTIGEVSTLVVRVQVSELDVVSVREGDEVRVVLDAYPGRTLRGVVRRIFPAADPTTRLVPVEVALEPETIARPGFLARVTFPLDSRGDVMLLPAAAIVGTAERPAVYLAREGTAVERPVQVGMTSLGRVEVVGGLMEGDTVLVAGNREVRDGGPIRIVSGPGAEGGPNLALPTTTEGGEG